jgi:Fur family transcriptional regulator, ferric uptake regulator
MNQSVFATDSQLGRAPGRSLIHRQPLLKQLIARGIRMTAQRRVLVGIIQEASRHLDASALLRLARKQDPEIDRATVYRTLDLLKRQGLIDELDLMHLEGEKHYYEVKTSRDHCHLACLQCGAILECASPSFDRLKAEMAKQSGFAIEVIRLEIGGLCKSCRKSQLSGNAKAQSQVHPVK